MPQPPDLRQLLVADIALIRGHAEAAQVAEAIRRSDEGVLAVLAELTGIEDATLEALGREADALLENRGEPRYRDFQVIGKGGMGVVYGARDTLLNRRVAFKVVRPNIGSTEDPPDTPLDLEPVSSADVGTELQEELEGRFLQEAYVTGGLEHPGIVPIYDLGRTERGVPFYTMRLVRGRRTLGSEIAGLAGRGFDDRIGLLEPFLRLCDTLGYAHARDVVHRDLKPENVALGRFGEVVLIDWGIAKSGGGGGDAMSVWQQGVRALRESSEMETMPGPVGTPGYMAPEAVLGEVDLIDARSDVYSLGAILFKILTGSTPFPATNLGEYGRLVVAEDAPLASDVDPVVPADLAAICARALARGRADRTPSAEAFANELRRWQTQRAAEREAGALFETAEGMRVASADLRGEALLRQCERITGLITRIEDLGRHSTPIDELKEAVDDLRRRAVEQREHAARRRVLKRAGVVVLALVAVGALLMARLIDEKREAAESARVASERARKAQSDTETFATYVLAKLRRLGEGASREQVFEEMAKGAYDVFAVPKGPEDLEQLFRRARVHAVLGDLRARQDRVEEARRAYETSVALYDELSVRLVAEASPATRLVYEISRANQRITYGEFFRRREPAKARVILEQAVKIARWPAETDPNHDQAVKTYIGALLAYGSMLKLDAAYKEALPYLDEAGRRLRPKPQTPYWNYERALAAEHTGAARGALGDEKAERKGYAEAEKLLRGLLDAVPDNQVYRAALGRVVQHRASLQSDRAKAKALLEEARQTWEGLLEVVPEDRTYQRDLSSVHISEGDLAGFHKDFDDADAAYAAAVKLRRQLLRGYEDLPQPRMDLAVAHLRRARNAIQAGKPESARPDLRAGVGLYAEHADQPGATWIMANLRSFLAKLDLQKDPKAAKTQLQAAIPLLRELLDKTPGRFRVRNVLIWCQTDLGAALLNNKEPMRSARAYLEGARFAREGLRASPGQSKGWQDLLAAALGGVHVNITRYSGLLGQAEFAPILDESLTMARDSAAAHPENVRLQKRAAWFLGYDGLRHMLQGRIERARETFREALDTERIRMHITPTAFYNAACAAARSGDTKDALAMLDGVLQASARDLQGKAGDGPRKDLQGLIALAPKDGDLASLHALPAFSEWLKRATELAAGGD